MAWMFPQGDPRLFWYSLIVIDPPWDFENYSEKGTLKGADQHYRVQPIDWIKALPVSQIARPDCLLLMWCTGCMMPQNLEVLKAWGFTFKSEMIWRKTTKNGKVRMGPGYRVRTMHEPILVATLGNPKHKAFPSIFDGLAREHSRKPDEFYELINKYAPGLTPRADIFVTASRRGWEGFGDQLGKFNAEAVDYVEPGTPG